MSLSVVNQFGEASSLTTGDNGELLVGQDNNFQLSIPLTKNTPGLGLDIAGANGLDTIFNLPFANLPAFPAHDNTSIAGLGRGYIKISDFDPLGQATKMRVNVSYAIRSGVVPSTDRSSWHLFGFPDTAEVITSSTANQNIDPVADTSCGLVDVIGDSNQHIATRTQRTDKTIDGVNDYVFFSTITDNFEIAYPNYYLRFDNSHSGQPAMILYATLTLYS